MHTRAAIHVPTLSSPRRVCTCRVFAPVQLCTTTARVHANTWTRPPMHARLACAHTCQRARGRARWPESRMPPSILRLVAAAQKQTRVPTATAAAAGPGLRGLRNLPVAPAGASSRCVILQHAARDALQKPAKRTLALPAAKSPRTPSGRAGGDAASGVANTVGVSPSAWGRPSGRSRRAAARLGDHPHTMVALCGRSERARGAVTRPKRTAVVDARGLQGSIRGLS